MMTAATNTLGTGSPAAPGATAPPAPGATAPAEAAYRARLERLREQYLAIPPGAPVRLAKRTSNLFRPRSSLPQPGLDVAAFDGVLAIDPVARTGDVQGMTTYERLVEATLSHSLLPRVVPELRTITLGGAVSGLGVESPSFRNGLVHESVLELEVMTGDGRIVLAQPQGEHRDLFRGFPNSYGTLGYALRVKIELEPVRPYVRLRHLPFADADAYFGALAEIAAGRSWEGEPVDFMDGTVFARRAHYLTLGTMVDDAPPTSDYSGQEIYYRSIPRRREDHLTIHDYIWRWDTDWFWCSRAFGAQRPRLRRLWPKRWLRSDVYWRIAALARRYEIVGRLRALKGGPGSEPLIQDVQVPVQRAAEFLRVFHEEIGMVPIWVCPVRARAPEPWPLYELDPQATYVNFGFWGMVERRPGAGESDRNRLIERLVGELGGRKSLYSTSFYDREEFHKLYGGALYDELKSKYDPGHRLGDLYEKCVKGS